MGEQEGWAQPSAIVPNGLLPNDGDPLIRMLDPDRWFEAEKRTADLIRCIQPNPLSEERREAVAKYVVKLVTKCFPCKVFPFGSVPLKTYLPDGDIDLTTFSSNQSSKDTWANLVRDILESEEKNLNAEYHVKEVQYVQAEVKIVKCLIDNIVVDISFNQLGGLCTLCFLEEVDHLINKDHLFKRSIILIKAWCYYESRILGAHHGLISTYALETLVLYIFHVFNNTFAGPLEVLYRFLEFFSNFDWENFCVSLWGPVPIRSLPDVTPHSPRKDSGELLLKKAFLESCNSAYAVVPGALETHGSPFGAKYFNVIDPLRANNNLGRSVSKGNFFRIRSAFAFGARKLARLLDCPKEDVYFEVNQFFMNTWSRHGSGIRPDAPGIDFGQFKLPQTETSHCHESFKNDSRAGSVRNNISNHEVGPVENPDNSVFPQYGKDTNCMSSPTDVLACSHDQEGFVNPNSVSRTSNRFSLEMDSKTTGGTNKGQKSVMVERVVSDGQSKYIFARTRSSPELTDAYNEVQSRGKHNFFVETGNASNVVGKNEKKNNSGCELQNIRSSVEVPSYAEPLPSSRKIRANLDASLTNVASNISSSQYHADPELFVEHGAAVEKQGIKQEEREIASIPMTFHGFNGAVPVPQVHRPLNLSAAHLPVPISPFLASMGYVPSNASGSFLGNPLIEHPWGTNVQLAQGMFSLQMAHYFPNSGHISNLEDISKKFNERASLTETNSDVAENDTWIDHDMSSSGGFDLDNGSLDMQAIDDQLHSNSSQIVSSYSASGSANLIRNNNVSRENKGSLTTQSVDSFQCSNYIDNDDSFDGQTVNSKNIPASRRNSLRSRTSSKSSWDGLSAKTKEKRGRKIISPDIQSSIYGKCKSAGDNSNVADDEAYRDKGALSTIRTNLLERNTGLPSVAPLDVSRHQLPGSESTRVNGSNVIPFGPMVLRPGRQKSVHDSGAPLTFFPTGPPVPFFTMLPLYNLPSETVNSERTTPLVKEEALNDSGQRVESAEIPDNSEVPSMSGTVRRAPYHVSAVEQKSDILNGDFTHHLNNLQYGRLCQVPNQEPLVYPPSAVVPSMYLQGHVPWAGPGRPSAHISQYMSYGPHVGPVTPFQAMSISPVNPCQQIADEMPRYRSGTGTYLPNPAHVRERPSSGSRKGYNNDRSDHNSDREGKWNHNKLRAAGRSHTRSQAEKASSRLDRWAINESRADRSSSSSYSKSDSYQSQNGRSKPELGGHGNVAYGVYPKSSRFQNAMSSNGPLMSPMMMLYPYDHYRGYGLSADQLEFGSLGQVGQVGTSGANEMARLVEDQSCGVFEEQIYHSSHAQWASPDQPSSPQLQSSFKARLST